MKGLNNVSDKYEELLSYFDNGDIFLENSVKDVIRQFSEVIKNIEAKSELFRHIVSNKSIDIKEIDNFLQNINDVVNLSKSAEEFYGNHQTVFNSLLEIIRSANKLIIRIPIVADIETSPFGGRVWGRDFSSFYTIDHQCLLTILVNLKGLSTQNKINNLHDSEISSKIEELTEVFHHLRLGYLPDALYVKIPDFFAKAADLLKDLKKLIRPFSFVINKNFFKETVQNLKEHLEVMNDYLIEHPSEEKLELKGKFKKFYRTLEELTQFLLNIFN